LYHHCGGGGIDVIDISSGGSGALLCDEE